MLKIGVIGCGAIGKKHIHRLQYLIPQSEVVACSDYFAEAAQKAAELYGVAQVYETGEELIHAPEVEAVVITSSDDSHAKYVLEAVKQGKQVFCEKPLAVTAADWVEQVIKGAPAGPSSWDGYAACVAADVLNKSRGTESFLPVKMIDKPDLYKQPKGD